MRHIDNYFADPEPTYGYDYPGCSVCGHMPKEHKLMREGGCQAYNSQAIWIVFKRVQGVHDIPCACDCYDEPEKSRQANRGFRSSKEVK
jgi:hypothetical protein